MKKGQRKVEEELISVSREEVWNEGCVCWGGERYLRKGHIETTFINYMLKLNYPTRGSMLLSEAIDC